MVQKKRLRARRSEKGEGKMRGRGDDGTMVRGDVGGNRRKQGKGKRENEGMMVLQDERVRERNEKARSREIGSQWSVINPSILQSFNPSIRG
jgi:hypothetical protein